MKKKLDPETRLKQIADDLEKTYRRWEHYRDDGGSDPSWPDGVNMNLLRNRAFYFKNEIQQFCEENGLSIPDICRRPAPPETPNDYMARRGEIADHARESLARYEVNPDYLYLLENREKLNEAEQKIICVSNIIRYVSALKDAITRNDFVYMRRHEHSECYIRSFQNCAERMREILAGRDRAENAQLSLF